MATSKKQISDANKPEDKKAATEAKYESKTVAGKEKITTSDVKKSKEKPRVFVSSRVWPD